MVRISEHVSFEKTVYGTVIFKNFETKAFMFTDQDSKDGNIKRTITMQDKQNNSGVCKKEVESKRQQVHGSPSQGP